MRKSFLPFILLLLLGSSFAWWNASYTNRFPINCTGVTAGTPIAINGSAGFYISGNKQTVWTTCGGNSLSLYYNNASNYAVANESAKVPYEVESGNGTSYQPTQVWATANAVSVYHMTGGGATITDSTGRNTLTRQNTNCFVESPKAPFTNFGFSNVANFSVAACFWQLTSGAVGLPVNADPFSMSFWQVPITPGGSGGTDSGYWGGNAVAACKYVQMYPLGSATKGSLNGCGADYTTSMNTYTAKPALWGFTYDGSNRCFVQNKTQECQAGITYTLSSTFITLSYAVNLMDEFRIYNGTKSQKFYNDTYDNAQGTAGFGNLGASEANGGGSPTNTLSVTLLAPSDTLVTSNKTQNFSYSVNSSWLPTPVNVLLYLDGALIANNTTTTNATLSNLYTTTHGLHTWNIFAYNSTNLSMNASSGNFSFEVQFNVTAIGPANGTILQGNTTTLYYSTQNFYGINCTTYLDGSNVDYRVLNSSSSPSILVNAASGSHTWYASCVAGDNAGYVKNTSTLLFSMNFASFNNTLNLTSGPENVLASPQAMFYDINGSLNVLYFTDDGASRTLRVKTIENNSVTCAANATLQPTSAFMLALREINQTVLLSFNSSDSTQARLTNFSSCTLASGTGSFPYAGAGTNSNYDPYTYAYTKQYPTLSLTASSYYLFTVPLPNGTGLFRKNISSGAIVQVGAQFPTNYAPAWQTVANSSNLSGWYYLEPSAAGAVSLGYYDGTARTVLETLDAQAHTVGQLNQSIGIFESYGGKTYAMLANLGNTTIHLIEDNRTLTINENISQPSHFFFVDEYTFLFFNTAGSATSAYSCYFATAANCTKYTAGEYGISMPYERGQMATAKRDGLSDVVAKGQINSADVVQLLYNLNTYDAKYRCYNEMDEARKTFTVQIYTNTTSNILQNYSWGYIIPSDNLGAGLKKSFFICANSSGDAQLQRMFLSGLTGNFTINAYSLNNGLGAYYTITVVDEFGQPVAGAKVSAYRFSPLNSAFVVIEQAITDSTGSGVLYLQPFTLYRLTIEQAGYVTLNFDFTPTAVTTVNIRLSSASSPLTLPDFYYLWDDISYSLTPSTSFSTNATNITYQVSSNSSGLEYYGLEVIRTFPNGTTSTVYSNNVSGQPSGGILTYPITTQGSYQINPYFKLQNFSEYDPFTKIFKYQNVTMGFVQARELFNQTQPITGWVFYLIAVVCAMLAVGFASKYTGDGAGLVGLAVLWGFSLFNPAVEIVCVAGLAGTCITPVIATAFATVATIAALYAKQFI